MDRIKQSYFTLNLSQRLTGFSQINHNSIKPPKLAASGGLGPKSG